MDVKMNIKNKLLFIVITLLMTFLLPNYAKAAFTFSAHDTQGRILDFSNPVLISGTAVAAGAGTASVGAKFKYTNVITVDGIQVDAIVTVDNIVNMTITKFDDPKPNPTPKNPARRTLTGTTVNYVTSFGVVVPEGAIFAPQLTAPIHTADSHVDFTISFQDTSGNAVVLQNVYNNSLDDENVEYNEFGGFVSYLFSSDYKTNTVQHMVGTAGLNGKIRFSNSNCTGNSGLYITDSSRVQTRFNTITSLKLTLGQFANGTVPTGVGSAVSTCTNSGVRYYGAIFVKDEYTETGLPPVGFAAPTVNFLTTSNTKPSITGTLGGVTSVMSPDGSALAAGETFSIIVNGVTYTSGNANLVMSGANWTLNIPTALPIGTYEVSTARTGGLVDQTNNELIITPTCTLPQILNLTLTACMTPLPTDPVVCHTGDKGDKNGDGLDNDNDDPLRHYAKILIPVVGTNGHETHEHDKEASNGVAGKECPDDVPICSSTQVLDSATRLCITAVRPTVNTKTTTTLVPAVLTGTVGTSTGLTISVKDSSGVVQSTGAATISGTTWSYTSANLAAGTYEVVALGNGGIVDISMNELTVTLACASPQVMNTAGTACITPVAPTVNSTTTTDKIAASLSGTVGTSTSLTITVNGVSGAATISGTTWTYTPAILPNGTYNVIATGNTGLVDSTVGELVVTATTVPTVNNATTNDKVAASLSGTVGTSSSITITVNGVSGAAVISGNNWTYTPAILPAGTYNVTATGNTGLVDTTTGELVVSASVSPTITCPTSTTTTTGTATITGTYGTGSPLTITVKNSSNVLQTGVGGTVTNTVGGSSTATWSLNLATLSTAGIYTVTATGVPTSLTSSCSLVITQTPVAPTVATKTFTDSQIPDLTGTVGSSTSLTITVNDSTGAKYLTGAATITGTTWSFTAANKLPAGTYEVVATGETGLQDVSNNELTITLTVVACINANSWTSNSTPPAGGEKQGNNVKICKYKNNNDFSKVEFNNNPNTNDTYWQYDDANCPASYNNCKLPTVDTKVTTDQATSTILTGTTGTGSYLKYLKIPALNVNEIASSTTSNSRLSYVGTVWRYTYTGQITAGIYSVEVQNNNNAIDITSDELTVTQTPINPTISCPVSTTDKLAATITGTYGSGSPLTITVKNSSDVPQTTGTVTNSGSTTTTPWTFTSIVLPTAGTYTVTATGVPTSLTASCTFTVTQTPIAPTVDAAKTTDLVAPVLSGSSGTSTSLTIAITGKPTISCPAVIDTVAQTWTCTASAAIPAATYTVTATGTSGVGTGTLTVTAGAIPTVNVNDKATDKVAPVLTGNVGASSSLTITIKSTPSVTGAATISGSGTTKTWTFTSPSLITAGNYDVEALGETGLKDATTSELTVITCTLPKVYNAAGDACIDPVPTVVTQPTTDSSTPVITGTVGVVALGSTETFTVTVNNKTYSKGDASLVISGVNWTLTIPATNAIPAGTYDIVAARNSVSKDTTTNELTISLSCVVPQVMNAAHTACVTPSVPTVDVASTTDKIAPTLTGTVGTSVSLMITIKDSAGAIKASGAATINAGGTSWTYTSAAVLDGGIYEVVALGDGGLFDATTNELTVTATCSLPKVKSADGTKCVYPTPTVTPKTITKAQQPAVLAGLVGTTALGNGETFTVTVNGVTYNQSTVIVSGMAWTLTIPTTLEAGTYNVDAIRSGVSDETSGELIITDKIDICNNGTDQTIERSQWIDWQHDAGYYLGKCAAVPCTIITTVTPTGCKLPDACVITETVSNVPAGCATPDLPKDPEASCETSSDPDNDPLCPRKPSALVDEAITVLPPPAEITYCYDATRAVTGVMSDSTATDVTIKRARIANAETQNGTIDPTTLSGKYLKYGTKNRGTFIIEPYTSSTGATITPVVKQGKATGVKVTDAVITGAYIDPITDYIVNPSVSVDKALWGKTNPDCANADGSIKSSCYIKVVGGTTTPTSLKEGATVPTAATITSGMITTGTDASGNPLRGSITTGQINLNVINTDTVMTQGRRIKGTIMNATIENATATTVSGTTVITNGTVVSGEMDPETTAKTFGTVLNATVTGVTISKSNQCFSGGTVGSRGQLNWKEVVK